jgi:hypothetical protein
MLLRLLLAAALAASLACAQEEGGGGGGGGGSRGGGGGGGRGGGGGGMSMRPQMPTPFERITTAFTLTKEQKKDFKSLIDEISKEAAPVREQIVQSRAQLLAAAQAGKSQAELKKLADSHAGLMARMTHLEMTAFGKICAKSSDAQRKQGAAALFTTVQGLFMKKNWDSN